MIRSSLLLTFALCSALTPLVAHADETSHRAKAEQMIAILHLDRMVTQVSENLMQQTAAATTQRYGGHLTPEQQASLSEFQKKLAAVVDPQIGWKAIEPEYVRVYTENFTEEQLDGMLAFYKSPAGVALMEKMPGITQQVGKLMQTRVAALQPQVKQMFEEYAKTLAPSAPAPMLGPVGPGPAGMTGPAAPSPAPAPKSPPQ